MKKNLGTAELARATIRRSIRWKIKPETALRELLQKMPLERPPWMTMRMAKARRITLFRCVMHLIPQFEPGKINANFKGKVRDSEKRLSLMREMMPNGDLPALDLSPVPLVETLRTYKE